MIKKKYSCDVLIVGSGVSGLATAMYSARFNLKPIVVGDTPGGVITTTEDVSNYPGFKKLTGMELADKVRDHALDYGVEIMTDYIEKIEVKNFAGSKDSEIKGEPAKFFKRAKLFIAESPESIFEAKTVVLATGTKNKKLGVSGEEEFMGKGVHTCALCDAPFYKNKVVAVIGGSDSAAKEVLLLAEHAKKVYMIHRREKIRPEPINEKRIEKSKNIEIIPNTNVLKIVGDRKVTSVVLDKPYQGKKELVLDGIFVAIGHVPLSGLARDLGAKLNSKGEVMVNRNSQTNVPGLFAAGDVVDTKFKQAITGVAEGVTASYFAYEYITENF